MPSLALGGGHKDLKTPAAATELRQRARAALLGLEDRDTAEQAAWGAQRLIAELHAPWVAEELLKELLAGLDACCAAARRARYRWRTPHACPLGFFLPTPCHLDSGNLHCVVYTKPHACAEEELAAF